MYFDCGASEGLTLFPVLARWATVVVLKEGECTDAVVAFIALCEVLDMLVSVKRGNIAPNALQRAILRHLRLHQIAYGTEVWKVKHHYAMHFGFFLRISEHLLHALHMKESIVR